MGARVDHWSTLEARDGELTVTVRCECGAYVFIVLTSDAPVARVRCHCGREVRLLIKLEVEWEWAAPAGGEVKGKWMQPYNPAAKCPKCGHDRVSTTHCTGYRWGCPAGRRVLARQEHLDRRCLCCGQGWIEACLPVAPAGGEAKGDR